MTARLIQNKYQIRPIQGFYRLSEWFIFRFFHYRILLNWSWEPDKYDFLSKVSHFGIYSHENELVGGARVLFPVESSVETMLFGEKAFRQMLYNPNELESILESKPDFFAEATRLLVSCKCLPDKEARAEILQMILFGVYIEMIKHNTPILLMVTQPTLYKKIIDLGLCTKTIGEAVLPARNRFERSRFGSQVPHYALAINTVMSETKPQCYQTFVRSAKQMGLGGVGENSPVHEIEQIWRKI